MCCVIIVSFLTPLGKESDDPRDLRRKLDEDRRRAARERLFNERRFPKGKFFKNVIKRRYGFSFLLQFILSSSNQD